MTPPPRSVLYLPASNARALAKARALPCDAVVLDLEDAVAPEEKDAARAAACAAVREGGFGRRSVVVRVNGLDTSWGADDLEAVSEAGPDAVLVPKIGGPEDVLAYANAVASAPERTRLWIMVETARAILDIAAVAAAPAPRLEALLLGPNDLARETGWRMTPGREPFFSALSLTVAAGKACGLAVFDGPFGGIEDLEGLRRECLQARDFGFDGKSLIHPSHLEICNAAFTPDPEEVAQARAVLAAFADPANAGRGALRVGGRMAERLHLGLARALIARAEAAAGAV